MDMKLKVLGDWEGVLKVSGRCLAGHWETVWKLSGNCLINDLTKMLGSNLEFKLNRIFASPYLQVGPRSGMIMYLTTYSLDLKILRVKRSIFKLYRYGGMKELRIDLNILTLLPLRTFFWTLV